MHSWIHPFHHQKKNARSSHDHGRLASFKSLLHKTAMKLTNTYRPWFAPVFWVLTALLFATGVFMLAFRTPTESEFGPVQKIFYLHLPTALCMFVAAFTLFIASAGFLWTRSMVWDDLAKASGRVTVLLCTIVLFTGMIWGKSEWGNWWTWSPRLTFSLVLWILYVVYLIIRPSVKSQSRRATISAVYGLAAFIDVPLVYASVKLMPDIHPSSIELNPAMQLTLLVWSIAIPFIAAGLIATDFSLNRRQRALHSTSCKDTASGEQL